jgi:hypothetical protein
MKPDNSKYTAAALLTFGLVLSIVTLYASTISVNGQSRIANFVSAGGPDVEDPDLPFDTGPGIDKNYSLTAFKYADGTANGILIDRWGRASGLPGSTALRADIDCVHVVDNNAWVSGVVTQGLLIDEFGEIDLAGWYVRTRVQDNGNNNDAGNPDRIGISVIRNTAPFDCTLMLGGSFDMPNGQVTIR